jgi:hypothetical protein
MRGWGGGMCLARRSAPSSFRNWAFASVAFDVAFVIASGQGCGILNVWLSERSSAWLEHLVWDQDVAGSNPVAPTNICLGSEKSRPATLSLQSSLQGGVGQALAIGHLIARAAGRARKSSWRTKSGAGARPIPSPGNWPPWRRWAARKTSSWSPPRNCRTKSMPASPARARK